MQAALVVLEGKEQTADFAKQLIRAAQAAGIGEQERQVVLFSSNTDQRKIENLKCSKVICFQGRGSDPKSVVDALVQLEKEEQFGLFLFVGTGDGDQVATRLGMHFKSSVVTQIDCLDMKDDSATVIRDVYGCNLKAEIELKKSPYCLSIRREAYGKKEESHEVGRPKIETRKMEQGTSPWKLIEYREKKKEAGLDQAKVVIVGGRGIGGKAGFERLKQLADMTGGVVGATRPAVTDGWAERERMVGISGKIIHPDLCIAIGASGAMPFASGIQESGKIIAINDDSDSLIFKVSDAGAVLDWHDVVDELLNQLGYREKKG